MKLSSIFQSQRPSTSHLHGAGESEHDFLGTSALKVQELGPSALSVAMLGLLSHGGAMAQDVPQAPQVQMMMTNHQDSQPYLDRTHVDAQSLTATLPIKSMVFQWRHVADQISGATPRAWTSISMASRPHAVGRGAWVGGMSDERVENDWAATWLGGRNTVGATLTNSVENDYASHGWGIKGTRASLDNNTTVSAQYAVSNDTIGEAPGALTARGTHTLQFGLLQNLTRRDVFQAQVGQSSGSGNYDDPYKLFDHRPDTKKSFFLFAKGTHWATRQQMALSGDYRFYSDTFGIKAHTVDLSLTTRRGPWISTPAVRYYTQNSATFFLDNPVTEANARSSDPTGALRINYLASVPWLYMTTDQRLSAFGSLGASWDVQYRWSKRLSWVASAGYHEQRSSWRPSFLSPGSLNMDALRYRTLNIGVIIGGE